MKSILYSKSVTFGAAILRFCDQLNSEKKFAVSNQLIRSGTSIGANISEAQFASSKADMINKFKIAEKEAHETAYWFELLHEVGYNEFPENINEQLIEIRKMLSSSIRTLREGRN